MGKSIYTAKNHSEVLPIRLYGITLDLETSNYVIILEEIKDGSLKSNLMIKKHNPNDKYINLHWVAKSLSDLHKCNLVHGDFHSGNLLLVNQEFMVISDLGLSKPADNPVKQMKFMEYFLIFHQRFCVEVHIQKLLIYILLVS